MDFPLSYFEDEIRDGFLVPSIMKKNWASNYNAYETLCALCDRLGLRVFANWGSLLGAVRHGGMIPWDDDIDVEMTRKEYLRLVELQNENAFPENYWLVDYSPDKIFNSIVKFADYKQLILHPDDWKTHVGFPFSAIVDIFMLDFLPSDDKEREKLGTIIENAVALEQDENREQYYNEMAKWLGAKFEGNNPKWLQLARAVDKYLVSFTSAQSDKQIFLWNYIMGSEKSAFSKFLHEDTIEMPFEQGMMKVPVGYDSILRLSYGNYMNVVKVYDNHDYPNYQVMEEKLEREYRTSLLHYEYDAETVREVCSKKKEKITLAGELMDSAGLLSEAHRFIMEGIENRENLPVVLDVLAQCQTLAVSIGNRIEEKAVGGEEAVRDLEEYCDVVFGIYENILAWIESSDGQSDEVQLRESAVVEDIMRRTSMLPKYEQTIREDIRGLREKREIVFLPYKSEHWKAMHTLWEKYSRDEEVSVTVIPVPYYYRDSEQEPVKELCLDIEGYPTEVALTSYEEYNFEVHHPDVVIYQFPYDEYSYALTLHPFFYASNLRQYVEKMVFIPPFLLSEIEAGDMRSRYTLGCFVRNPGLVYADEIVVQSEQMKSVYIELLETFTESEIDWDSRIVGTGFPLLEWEERKRVLFQDRNSGKFYTKGGQETEKTLYDEVTEIPTEWLEKITRQEGGFRKIILYYVSGSMMLEYGKKAVDKISKVLDAAKTYKDELVFLWHMDPYAEKILKSRIPNVWSSYREMIELFRKEEMGILDESKDCHVAVNLCDGFYGDGGTIMNECRMLGKPVLWENPEVVA